ASMRRGRDERETMLRACGGLYEAGATVAWERVIGVPEHPVDLPPYPWQRQRYWLRDAPSERSRHRPAPLASGSGLLGARHAGSADSTATFSASTDDPALGWLVDHVIGGHVL